MFGLLVVLVDCFSFGIYSGWGGFEGVILVVLLFWGLRFFWLVWFFCFGFFLQRRK